MSKSSPQHRDPVGFHSDLARQWSGLYRKGSFHSRQASLEKLLRDLDIQKKSWIDLGCGSGTLSTLLVNRGATVRAVDASAPMIEAAREILPKQLTDKIRFEVGDIAKVDCANATYDGALCSSVLEYVDDVPCCVREAARIVKPGGYYVFSVPNPGSLLSKFVFATYRITRALGRPYPQWCAYSRNRHPLSYYRDLLQASGWAIVSESSFGAPYLTALNSVPGLSPLIWVLAQRQ